MLEDREDIIKRVKVAPATLQTTTSNLNHGISLTRKNMKRERNAGYFSEINLLSIQNNQMVFNNYTPDVGK